MKKLSIAVSMAALLFATGCHHDEHHKEEATPFIVTNPVIKDTLIFNEYVCQVRSIQHIELRALERGYLQNIYVDEGQFVHKGQLLFQIMPLIYQAEQQKAQAEMNFADIEYQNTKALADRHISALRKYAPLLMVLLTASR